jgi:hypothetical protein
MQRTLVRRTCYWPAVVEVLVVTALVLQPSPAPAAAAAPAAAPEPQWVGIAAAWSSPGSAGVADESSVPLVTFDHAKAAVRPSAPAGSLVWLRYPIFLSRTWSVAIPDPSGNTPGIFQSGYYINAKLTLSFQRNDEGALILALLRRVRLSDGETTTMTAVDGLSSPPSPGVQTVSKNLYCAEGCVQPDQYAYWVEVALWKVNATSDPKIVAVGVHLTPP